MNSFIGKIGGRKFLVALVGLIGVIVAAVTGFDLAQHTTLIVGIVAPYLIGQGVADGLSKGATATTTPDAK